jgi:hypothetical protein
MTESLGEDARAMRCVAQPASSQTGQERSALEKPTGPSCDSTSLTSPSAWQNPGCQSKPQHSTWAAPEDPQTRVTRSPGVPLIVLRIGGAGCPSTGPGGGH